MPKVHRLHFVCHESRNVRELANGHYDSSYWHVSYDHAKSAKQIALHESRASLSYRQGNIIDYRLCDYEGKKRYIFTVAPTNEMIGASTGKGENPNY